MKTDRLVNRLHKTLEEKYPLEILSQDTKEGVNIWKGKKVIAIGKWLSMIAILENDKVLFDLGKGFDYFPDAVSEAIFQYGIEGCEEYYKEISKETFENWFKDYLDLLAFKRNPDLGRMICRNCLLEPTKDKSGLNIGIHKMVARVLQKELRVNSDYATTNQTKKLFIYPCNVLNYFSCPYQSTNGEKQFGHEFDSDIEFLFELEQITHSVDISLLKASSMTKSNETIYEIDIESNIVKEIQTLYNGKQIVMVQQLSIEKMLYKIEEKSVVPVKNKEDIADILKDNNKLDKILKQGLSNEDYHKWRNNILNYFKKFGAKLKFDYPFKYDVYENLAKHTCKECDQRCNIHLVKGDKWYCKKHFRNRKEEKYN